MDKKIRILHVISDTNIGGAGKLLLNLSKCIDKNKFELVFAVPQGSKLKIELKKEGRVYSFLGKGDKSADILAVPSICRIIKGVRPNIVHTHSSISGRIAAIISGIKKEKIVYTHIK